VCNLSLCNSSLNKSQSKLPDRRHRARHHTQLWEKVPGHPYHVRTRRKAPPQKHFAAYSSRDLHPSLASARRSHSHLETVRLGSAVRGIGPSGLPRKGRRGYESALSSCRFAVGSGRVERRWVDGPGSKLDSRYVRGPFVAVNRHAVACLRSSDRRHVTRWGLFLRRRVLFTLWVCRAVSLRLCCVKAARLR
jgi:hypothetical protein